MVLETTATATIVLRVTENRVFLLKKEAQAFPDIVIPDIKNALKGLLCDNDTISVEDKLRSIVLTLTAEKEGSPEYKTTPKIGSKDSYVYIVQHNNEKEEWEIKYAFCPTEKSILLEKLSKREVTICSHCFSQNISLGENHYFCERCGRGTNVSFEGDSLKVNGVDGKLFFMAGLTS